MYSPFELSMDSIVHPLIWTKISKKISLLQKKCRHISCNKVEKHLFSGIRTSFIPSTLAVNEYSATSFEPGYSTVFTHLNVQTYKYFEKSKEVDWIVFQNVESSGVQ